MSELYEGVVIRIEQAAAIAAFRSLESSRPIRLVRLADRTFGIYPVLSRSEPLTPREIGLIAQKLSIDVGVALAVFYDNRCGLNAATLFQGGLEIRVFDEDDEVWISVDDSGEPNWNALALPVGKLDPDGEYACIRSAIDAGLTAPNIDAPVSADNLKQAFCYNAGEIIAESKI
jgi:hypothetical protein